MSKFIGKDSDKWGNIVYVIGFDTEKIEFSADLKKAILICDEDKKIINKIRRKQYKPSIKYIKLEKFESIAHTTSVVLREYNHHFLDDVAKYAKKQDDMSLECIDYAKNHVDDTKTFEEFGDNVANILIEKHELKKKEQPF